MVEVSSVIQIAMGNYVPCLMQLCKESNLILREPPKINFYRVGNSVVRICDEISQPIFSFAQVKPVSST